MNGKVFEVKKDKILMIGGLVMIENREKREVDLRVYGSENINYRVIGREGVNMYYYKEYNDRVYPVYDDDITAV